MFEVKQACYGGTAALRIASSMVAAGEVKRALVISTDTARCVPHSYAEPAQGCAAVALLVGRERRSAARMRAMSSLGENGLVT